MSLGLGRNFDVARGDTLALSLEFFTDTAQTTAQDITGWTVFLTVKEDIDDVDADALYEQDVTDHVNAVGGLTAVSIPAATTADWTGYKVYDVQIKKSDGSVNTVMSGKLRFYKDVTRRTS